jgi:hypothetical protein
LNPFTPGPTAITTTAASVTEKGCEEPHYCVTILKLVIVEGRNGTRAKTIFSVRSQYSFF